jgi:KDO2-lipid IV(A) lauroyltransferase
MQRIRVRLLRAAAWLGRRLPERVIAGVAWLAGAAWYRVTPARAEQARLNLRRVVRHLAATGLGGRRVGSAATDPAALEAMVREAYRQAVRYYLDMVRVSAGTELLAGRFEVETPDVVDRALATNGSLILVGLHFGALELPTLYLAQRGGRQIVVPMETLPDPALQSWLVETRSRSGVRIVGLGEARREMTAAIERGEIVGLVGDRDLSGAGTPVSLFGVPARLPVGPALFAIEAGIPVYVGAVRRDRRGRWIGELRQVQVPATGSRRERLTRTLELIAGAFEALVAQAPEQWWTLFFPIWDDLVVRGQTGRPARRARAAGTEGPGSGVGATGARAGVTGATGARAGVTGATGAGEGHGS